MSALHIAVVIAHGVQVVQVVLGVAAHAVGSSPRRPVRGEAPAALAPLDHVGRHVHPHQGEPHHVLHLHPPVAVLGTPGEPPQNVSYPPVNSYGLYPPTVPALLATS